MVKGRDEILNLLDTLIKTRSDSNSPFEIEIEDVIIDQIKKIPYFIKNEKQYGKSKIVEDTLDRNIVWALVDNGKKNTIIIYSHHDTVGVMQYGKLAEIAYDSEALKKAFIEQGSQIEDLHDENWLFGRGSCDMKAGIAINLNLLNTASEDSSYPNILFLSIPDKENASAGMRNTAQFLTHLKNEFKLNYKLAVLTEPYERDEEDTFTISTGSAGKMLPLIVTKGMPVHTGRAYSGLNAIGMIMEIIKAVELNTEMGDVINKKMTPPPAFLSIKDSNEDYDVTTPEYAAAYFSWIFLKSNLKEKLEQLKQLCVWSIEDAINQYNYSYNEFLRKQKLPSYVKCESFDVEVLMYEELTDMLKGKVDVTSLVSSLKLKKPTATDQEIVVSVIKSMIDELNTTKPIVVIGLLTPFYPVVDSAASYKSLLEETMVKALNDINLKAVHNPYFMEISDMSYLKYSQHEYHDIFANIPLMNHGYSIDFNGIKELDIEVINIGPWGKDMHLKTERIYIKDVVETVPYLLEKLFMQFNE